jgi:phage shock protein PspC (stress-responsive transcriptional regulator)
MSLGDEIDKLAQLRANGTLSDDEFRRAKERLLNGEPPRPGEQAAAAVNTLRRSRYDRWFGGVCGGIGRATGTDAWIWRLLFTLLFVCFGAGLLLYLLLWLFVPSE